MFSGDNEDAKEYKRWKTWVANKLLTLSDKVPKEAHGAYVYTLLSGKALECVEHLDPAEYQKEDGQAVLFKLLDQRFPQKDNTDEMAEVLSAVFSLKATEGESLKTWVSRASELFDRCQRKCNVSFPEEARGWIVQAIRPERGTAGGSACQIPGSANKGGSKSDHEVVLPRLHCSSQTSTWSWHG